MKVETTRFGTIEVNDDKLLEFPWGIPGFESIKRYVLLEYKDGPFQWLQAVDEPSLAFVVCPPEAIGVQYKIPREKLEPLETTNPNEVIILNLVSFDREKEIIRFHLRSPLLFNVETRKAYQWTMDKDEVKNCIILPQGMEWQEVK